MKNTLLAFFALPLLIACSPPKGNKMDFSQITFSMDTVMVDSKGEFLFLNWGLSTACISMDRQVLYNFNIQEPSLESIDLDKLELLEKQVFEKEGPDGVGNNGKGGIVHLGDDKILFKGWPSPEVFRSKGEKLPDLAGLYSIKTKVTGSGKDFMYEAVLPTKPQYVFGIINEFPGKDFEFGKINLLDSTLKSYPLPTWEKLADFTITYDDGNTYDILGPYIYAENVNQQIIVSSNVSSELYVYKPDKDSLYHYTYSYNLTQSGKTGIYATEISDPEQFHNIYKGIYSEVSFLSPIWDHDNQQYYRIHYESLFEDEYSGMYPKRIGSKVFISVYDKDLQLVGEVQLPQFPDIPGFHFAKDGKIWMFQNINDEMGFVRLSIIP